MADQPDLTIIAAYDRNRAIGRRGTIPWSIPSDLAHFQRTTEGGVVVMGRKTWESLPAKVRPLPNRFNMVVTTKPGYKAKGAFVCGSLRLALDMASTQFLPLFVIGGADIYAQALDRATKLVLTEVQASFPGCDTFFPEVDERDWVELSRELLRAPGDNHWHRRRVLVRPDQIASMDAIHHMLSGEAATRLADEGVLHHA